MLTKQRATVEDLYHVPENGKAELVNGELVRFMATGSKPGRAGGKIYISLNRHEETQGGGLAYPDNVGFLTDLPNRESFSPDAAWYTQDVPESEDMDFLPEAPAFAVEVRSKGDYGPAEEIAIEDKIADYFAAGTRVVWVVDLRSDDVIKAYHSSNPLNPKIFRRDEIADAEPAVPGWRFPVNSLFPSRRGQEAGNG